MLLTAARSELSRAGIQLSALKTRHSISGAKSLATPEFIAWPHCKPLQQVSRFSTTQDLPITYSLRLRSCSNTTLAQKTVFPYPHPPDPLRHLDGMPNVHVRTPSYEVRPPIEQILSHSLKISPSTHDRQPCSSGTQNRLTASPAPPAHRQNELISLDASLVPRLGAPFQKI